MSEWELEFTKAFAATLINWSKRVASEMHALGCSKKDVTVGGLPIGLSISRVVANTLLVGLDRDIEQGLPFHPLLSLSCSVQASAAASLNLP